MRTEIRTYEVYNLHELTERHRKRHTAIGQNIVTMLGTKRTEPRCKPLNGLSISRRKGGHTTVVPTPIVSLLITEMRKTI